MNIHDDEHPNLNAVRGRMLPTTWIVPKKISLDSIYLSVSESSNVPKPAVVPPKRTPIPVAPASSSIFDPEFSRVDAFRQKRRAEVEEDINEARRKVIKLMEENGEVTGSAMKNLEQCLKEMKEIALKTWDQWIDYIPDDATLIRMARTAGLLPEIEIKPTQLDGLKFAIYRDIIGRGSVLAHDPGMGKTLLSLLHDRISNLHDPGVTLVIAPSGVSANWVNDTIKYFGSRLRIIFYQGDNIKTKPWFTYGGKTGLKKVKHKEPITKADIDKCDLVITHIDALTTTWSRCVAEPVRAKLSTLTADFLEGYTDKEAAQKSYLREAFPQLDWSPFERTKANSKWVNVKIKENGLSIPLVGPVIGYDYKRIILDEAHYIRNTDTCKAQLCHSFVARYRIALTGTPAFNSLEDLWSLFCFVQVPRLCTNDMFCESVGALNKLIQMTESDVGTAGASGEDVAKKIKELREALNSNEKGGYNWRLNAARKVLDYMDKWMQQVTKNDVAEKLHDEELLEEEKSRHLEDGFTLIHHSIDGIPPAYKKVITIDPPVMLTKIHNNIRLGKKEEFKMLSKKEQSKFLLDVISHLRVLTTNHRDVPKYIYNKYCNKDDVEILLNIQTPKFAAVIDYIQDNVGENEKMILFIHFIEGCKDLAKTLNDMGIIAVAVHGQTTKAERTKMIEKFKTDPNIKVLVATHMLGHGLNFTEANHVGFVTEWWNFSEDKQCYSRVHRYGQTRDTMIVYFVLQGTIDEAILQRAQSKDGINGKIGVKEKRAMLGF